MENLLKYITIYIIHIISILENNIVNIAYSVYCESRSLLLTPEVCEDAILVWGALILLYTLFDFPQTAIPLCFFYFFF